MHPGIGPNKSPSLIGRERPPIRINLKTNKPIEILEEIENSTWSKDSDINSENITGNFNEKFLVTKFLSPT